MSRDIIIGAILLLALLGGLYVRETNRPQKKPEADSATTVVKAPAAVPKKSETMSSSGSPTSGVSPSREQAAQPAGTASQPNTPQTASSLNGKATAPLPEKSDAFRYQHSTSPEQALQTKDPKDLAATVLAYQNAPPESRGSLFPSLNALGSLGQQGSIAAVDELIRLAEQLKDNQLLHQVLQALGQSNQPAALQALSNALVQNLANPTETIRISSYFPTSSGVFEPGIVDWLLTCARDPAAAPGSREALLNAVYHKGGAYGHRQVQQLEGANAARFDTNKGRQANTRK